MIDSVGPLVSPGLKWPECRYDFVNSNNNNNNAFVECHNAVAPEALAEQVASYKQWNFISQSTPW